MTTVDSARRAEAGTAGGKAVPAPVVCPTCEGDRWMVVGGRAVPCSGCLCEICGQATDMPPECKSCAAAEEGKAKRRDDR